MKHLYKVLFCIVLGMILCHTAALAQGITVKGTVIDDTGAPMIGLTVVVTGTSTGATTDIDGNYSIQAPANGSLTFSYLGFQTQTIQIDGRALIDVQLMPDSELLSDAIVIGYGSSSKKDLTGSVSAVESKDFNSGLLSSPEQLINGKVAGVQISSGGGSPTSGSTIRIRGGASLNASNDPLIVIDGVPLESGGVGGMEVNFLSLINPNDIESMTVLKDAASNSLYGARGANGVIMITTKKSKQADAVINVDAKWGLNTKALQNYDVITDPGQYYETYYSAVMGHYKEKNPTTNDLLANVRVNDLLREQLQYMVYKLPSGEQLILRDGKLNPNATLGNVITSAVDGKEYLLMPDNWLDEAYRTSFRQEYNVSISGNVGAMSMFASFGYLNNNGIIYG